MPSPFAGCDHRPLSSAAAYTSSEEKTSHADLRMTSSSWTWQTQPGAHLLSQHLQSHQALRPNRLPCSLSHPRKVPRPDPHMWQPVWAAGGVPLICHGLKLLLLLLDVSMALRKSCADAQSGPRSALHDGPSCCCQAHVLLLLCVVHIEDNYSD